MSKRSCPFSDEVSQQAKIFLSEQEIHQRNDSYMELIRERTMRRLFEAQRNNNVDGSAPPQSNRQAADNVLCPDCRLPNPTVATCWFCNIPLCNICCKTCTGCSDIFCSKCSVPIAGNTFTCLTCYK